MSKIGKVSALWRYPVKSMQGETLQAARVTSSGIMGDRLWACRDLDRGEIATAKSLEALMLCTAAYKTDPEDGAENHIEITLPDGDKVCSDDPDCHRRISEALGARLRLEPLPEAADIAAFTRARVTPSELEREVRRVLAIREDDPFDLTKMRESATKFVTTPGTYFDRLPLHILTDASRAFIMAQAPGYDVSTRRFRPNIEISISAENAGLIEQQWIGQRVQIGQLAVDVQAPCLRCIMVTRAQPGLGAEPQLASVIARLAGRNLGVLATPAGVGDIACGDPLTIPQAQSQRAAQD